jgi:hypothetical protein
VIINAHSVHILVPVSFYLWSMLILSSPLRLGLSSCLFSSRLQTEITYAFLIATMHAICSAHLIVLDFVILTMFGKSKFGPAFNQVPRHKDVWRSDYITSWICSLSVRRSWAVCLTLRPFYYHEKSPGMHWLGCWVVSQLGLTRWRIGDSLSLPRIEPLSPSP